MTDILFGRYFSLYELLVNLLIALLACVVVGGAVYLAMRGRRHGRPADQERRPVEGQSAHENQHPQVTVDDLLSFMAHDFGSSLEYIKTKAHETLEGLGSEQTSLREKQKGVFFAASDVMLHAENVLWVFQPDAGRLEMDWTRTIKEITERVISELKPLADSNGVTVRQILDDVEPTPLNEASTARVLRNLIHNAIKYAPDGIVEVRLYLAEGADVGARRVIHVDVQDSGKGISDEDQATLFELRRRANGLIEPGSGLGLYCAQITNRRQGGDVLLVESSLGKGSTFGAIFPYRSVHEVPG